MMRTMTNDHDEVRVAIQDLGAQINELIYRLTLPFGRHMRHYCT